MVALYGLAGTKSRVRLLVCTVMCMAGVRIEVRLFGSHYCYQQWNCRTEEMEYTN